MNTDILQRELRSLLLSVSGIVRLCLTPFTTEGGKEETGFLLSMLKMSGLIESSPLGLLIGTMDTI